MELLSGKMIRGDDGRDAGLAVGHHVVIRADDLGALRDQREPARGAVIDRPRDATHELPRRVAVLATLRDACNHVAGCHDVGGRRIAHRRGKGVVLPEVARLVDEPLLLPSAGSVRAGGRQDRVATPDANTPDAQPAEPATGHAVAACGCGGGSAACCALAALQRARGRLLRLLGAALRLRDLLPQPATRAGLCGALGDARRRVRLHGVLRRLHPRLLEAGKLLVVGLPRLLARLRCRIVLLPRLAAIVVQSGRCWTWCRRRCGWSSGRWRLHYVAKCRGLDFSAIGGAIEHRGPCGAFRALVRVVRGSSVGLRSQIVGVAHGASHCANGDDAKPDRQAVEATHTHAASWQRGEQGRGVARVVPGRRLRTAHRAASRTMTV